MMSLKVICHIVCGGKVSYPLSYPPFAWVCVCVVMILGGALRTRAAHALIAAAPFACACPFGFNRCCTYVVQQAHCTAPQDCTGGTHRQRCQLLVHRARAAAQGVLQCVTATPPPHGRWLIT